MLNHTALAAKPKNGQQTPPQTPRRSRRDKLMAMAQLFGFKGVSDEFIEQLSESKEKLFSRQRSKMTHSADWNYYADMIKKGKVWTRGWT